LLFRTTLKLNIMSNIKESEGERISRQSKDILNKNGYSFQYSTISELINVVKKWKFYGAEIPVSSRGKNTHADFVFQDSSSSFYLIGECKRVQPNFADWVFVKTPFNSRKDSDIPLILDRLQEVRSNSGNHLSWRDVVTRLEKRRIQFFDLKFLFDLFGFRFACKSSAHFISSIPITLTPSAPLL